jgi:hypothetical protein
MEERLAQLEAHEHEQDARRLAVAMCLHKRLGAASALALVMRLPELQEQICCKREAWTYPAVGHDVADYPLHDVEYELWVNTLGQGNCGYSRRACFELCFLKRYVMLSDRVTESCARDNLSGQYFGPLSANGRICFNLHLHKDDTDGATEVLIHCTRGKETTLRELWTGNEAVFDLGDGVSLRLFLKR